VSTSIDQRGQHAADDWRCWEHHQTEMNAECTKDGNNMTDHILQSAELLSSPALPFLCISPHRRRRLSSLRFTYNARFSLAVLCSLSVARPNNQLSLARFCCKKRMRENPGPAHWRDPETPPPPPPHHDQLAQNPPSPHHHSQPTTKTTTITNQHSFSRHHH
jgi:hypothetical protein